MSLRGVDGHGWVHSDSAHTSLVLSLPSVLSTLPTRLQIPALGASGRDRPVELAGVL